MRNTIIHKEKQHTGTLYIPSLLLGVLLCLGFVPVPASAAMTSQEAAVATADASIEAILDKSVNTTDAVEANAGVQQGNEVILGDPNPKQMNAENSTPTLSQQQTTSVAESEIHPLQLQPIFQNK